MACGNRLKTLKYAHRALKFDQRKAKIQKPRTFSAACLAPVNLLLGLKKAQGLKPTSFLGLYGTTEVVP
jgi:hypothetical protein